MSSSEQPPEQAMDLEAPIDTRHFEERFDAEACEKAALPAALSASAYAASCWAFDVAAGVADAKAWMGEEQFESDRDGLARSLLIAGSCWPLEAKDLGVQQDDLGGSLSRGVFRRGDLAQALVAIAENESGGRELHLSVRGTDFHNNTNKALAAFQAIVGYFAWTYPRIEKHAENFKELAEAIAKKASDPSARIERVVVSGHSLGGAAAQSLIKYLAECEAPVRIVTFGSPGSGSGWLDPIDKAIKAIRWSLSSSFGALSTATDSQWEAPLVGGKPLAAFSALARKASHFFKEPIPKSGEPEQYHFRHPNDPIPKWGSLLYRVKGKVLDAMEPREFDLQSEGQELMAKGIQAHSSARYFRSIHSMMDHALEELTPWKDASFEMSRWRRAKVEALRLELSVTPEQAAAAIKSAREAALEEIKKLDPKDPSIERIEALPKPEALLDKIQKARRMRRLQTAMSSPGSFRDGLTLPPISKPQAG